MRKQILPVSMDVLLCWLLSVGSVSCMISGFQMEATAAFMLLALVWAVICCVCWRLKYGWAALVALLAVYVYFFVKTDAYREFADLLQIIGSRYYRAYGWDVGGFFSQADPAVMQSDVTQACTAIVFLQILVASLSLKERLPAFCALPLALLPLISTLVTIDSVPDLGAIFVLLLGIVLLVLTNRTRNRSLREGAKLTAMLLTPVALALSLLLNAVPQAGYVKPSFQAGDFSFLFPSLSVPPMTMPTMDITLPTVDVTLPPVDINSNKVNLDMVGPQIQLARKVMTIRSSYPGTIYLRAHSYAAYQGIQWDSEGTPPTESLDIPFRFCYDLGGKLEIEDRFDHDYRFHPYYADGGVMLENGIVPNPDLDRTYAYAVNILSDQWKQIWENQYADADMTVDHFADFAYPAYLKLSDKTRQRAREILDTLDLPEDGNVLDLADTIRSYVRSSASYDLNTPRMPSDEVDFAIWFLTESDTGYCIHFATAATVLLRAAGIPARYVEGYMVQTGGQSDDGMYTVEVQQRHAHAWVEYYVPNVGWVVLEATPAAGENPPPTTKPTDPTEPVVPTLPPTTQTTAPTQPSLPGTTAEETTVPPTTSSALPSTGNTQQSREGIPAWIWQSLLALVLTALVLAGQWMLRLYLRSRWLTGGSNNVRAVRLWRYGAFLARILKLPAPEGLFDLAQKAKFSQYTITDAELAAMDAWLRAVLLTAKGRNAFLQLLYRLVFAMY